MRLNQVSNGRIMAFAAALLMVVFVGCSDDDPQPEAPSFDIQVRSTAQGTVLTDSEGRTLYFFTRDTDGNSACTGGCISNWPAFSDTDLTVADGLDASYFGSINRPEGGTQVTYKGWPLYYFANDNAAGDVNGENVGGVWFVAKPDYDVMLAQQDVAGTDTRYLVDDWGNSLYWFANDNANESNCSGGCLDNWPIFGGENLVLPSALSSGDFGSIGAGASQQVTFETRPLYYFANDNTRGDVNGHNVGSVWFLEDIQ